MKNMLVIAVVMLATLACAAQQPNTILPSNSQVPSESSQAGDAVQPQLAMLESADQNAERNGTQSSAGQAANAPVTEGCLGGSDPNYTVTDKAGTAYKLNIPANADTSKLARHVGESVQVFGNLRDSGKSNASIDVQGIGRGTGICPANSSSAPQPEPKQK